MSETTTHDNGTSILNSKNQPKLVLVDYGAGNVRSLVNAVKEVGYDIEYAKNAKDILEADKIIFPGVGSFGAAMEKIHQKKFAEPLKQYISENRPFLGICVGLQSLCRSSEESPGVQGLGIIPADILRFKDSSSKAVPHMGWNTVTCAKSDQKWLNHFGGRYNDDKEYTNRLNETKDQDQKTFYYFVHSFGILMEPHRETIDKLKMDGWACGFTQYEDETFVSAIRKGNVMATQFHPEKSGKAGLALLKSFLDGDIGEDSEFILHDEKKNFIYPVHHLSKRIIACLDVRSNETGDLVVTKGDQYDVKEDTQDGGKRVRNLGKPVDLAKRYFEEGADEVTFLNITSFRDMPLKDLPMLEVLQNTSENVFVPLTIGGGIRDIMEPDGTKVSALDVAGEYFRSGADKVSIGSDAVYAAMAYYNKDKLKDGTTSIEQISQIYGAQAVVISVDPRRVYVTSPEETKHHAIKTKFPSTAAHSNSSLSQEYCWYQCTVKGGREGTDMDVVELVTACEALGAGEILLNCMDKDGTNSGFDLELLKQVKKEVKIPVIASSGAGSAEHFVEVFKETSVEAALAAGIFHRGEVAISDVKKRVQESGLLIRED